MSFWHRKQCQVDAMSWCQILEDKMEIFRIFMFIRNMKRFDGPLNFLRYSNGIFLWLPDQNPGNNSRAPTRKNITVVIDDYVQL